MKALKSKLASELLADPAASAQLRKFLVTRPREAGLQTRQFRLGQGDRERVIEATWVPRASAKTA